MSQERRDKVSNLFEGAKEEKRNGNSVGSRSRNVFGHGNIIVHGNINHLQDQISQEPEYFSNTQTYEIQQLIYKLADMDIACGFTKTGRSSARRKWWYVLRTHFKTTSYKLIQRDQYDQVITFLKDHVGKLRQTLSEKNDKPWRNKYYTAIYTKCSETGTTKDQLYQMVDHYLNSSIISLKQLSDHKLKHLYNLMLES